MNILTFDIEEWYLEKHFKGNHSYKYHQFDEMLSKILDELDRLCIKGTFFCVGQLAVEFPDVVRKIALKGHEVGCHSNVHNWLNKMDYKVLYQDTKEALKALQDVSGQKVTSYRAPALSITANNSWTVEVLAECGIESDASIFPTARDFGGYPSFPQDTPCKLSYNGVTLKEFPICITPILGKQIAYSGGGYFRLLPYSLINKTMKQRDYNICYFHLADLIHEEVKMKSKTEYEEYYQQPGTLKNRLTRYVKSNVGKGNAWDKLCRLLEVHRFINISEGNKKTEWGKTNVIELP
jgi:polysaccharide deacetylase family protein (PEP-CTERM system associated)